MLGAQQIRASYPNAMGISASFPVNATANSAMSEDRVKRARTPESMFAMAAGAVVSFQHRRHLVTHLLLFLWSLGYARSCTTLLASLLVLLLVLLLILLLILLLSLLLLLLLLLLTRPLQPLSIPGGGGGEHLPLPVQRFRKVPCQVLLHYLVILLPSLSAAVSCTELG